MLVFLQPRQPPQSVIVTHFHASRVSVFYADFSHCTGLRNGISSVCPCLGRTPYTATCKLWTGTNGFTPLARYYPIAPSLNPACWFPSTGLKVVLLTIGSLSGGPWQTRGILLLVSISGGVGAPQFSLSKRKLRNTISGGAPPKTVTCTQI